MSSFYDMLWVETRKAVRSWIPWFTAAAALFIPLGIAFLIFVATHPGVSQKLGLVSAKANLLAYAQTGWPTYLSLLAQTVAAGGYFLCCFVVSWIFGREFADGTVKDMLAVPVARGTILLAKFVIAGAWSAALAALMLLAGLLAGALMGLPQGSAATLLEGGGLVAVTACLTIVVAMPLAFFAGAGRGYLLPIGVAILLVVMANLLAVLGWGPYFPWAVPGLYAQAKGDLVPASYLIALLTGIAGMLATYAWWRYADQSR
jgi:ABC-2 type transport system permease protein